MPLGRAVSADRLSEPAPRLSESEQGACTVQVQCTERAGGVAAGSLVALSRLLLARRDVHADADFLIAGFAGQPAAAHADDA